MNRSPMDRGTLLFLRSPAVITVTLCTLLLARPGLAYAYATAVLRDLADRAVDQDPQIAKPAIAQLREAGPDGLAALMEANAGVIQRHRAMEVSMYDDQWPRVCAAIDAVAAQKDAWASGLYWYTDLEAAKKAAAESGKPILSLRLLGTLDTEFSCANSRFFRTVLYANAEVSKALSSRFVLHWKSVRPVPKVTIDFGDGRVVERTITGNSIHYVLDADGRVIDGIPGLYGPKAFLRLIQEAAAHAGDARSPKDFATLQMWHGVKGVEIANQWQQDLRSIGIAPDLAAMPTASPLILENGPVSINALLTTPRSFGGPINSTLIVIAGAMDDPKPQPVFGDMWASNRVANMPPPPLGGPPSAIAAAGTVVSKTRAEIPLVKSLSPTALAAAPMAMAKVRVERPLVAAIAPGPKAADPKALETATTDAAWARLAALRADDSRLDSTSRALMAAKHPNALASSRIPGGTVDSAIATVVQNFERSIAEDTVRNEYNFHRQIHAWLAENSSAAGRAELDVNTLNERVYAELFLTPSSDPWLGLLPADTYSALLDEGLCRRK